MRREAHHTRQIQSQPEGRPPHPGAGKGANHGGQGGVGGGEDPAVAKHVAKVTTIAAEGDAFQRVAMAWLDDAEHEAGWTPRYRQQVQRTLEQYVYPVLGQLPISNIRAAQVFPILQSLRLRTSSVGCQLDMLISVFIHPSR